MRTAALNRIDGLYEGNAYATGIMEATLIGESGKLEKIWTDHFRRTGTYHMLVIDGLHITVLAAFLLFLLRVSFVPELGALALAAAARGSMRWFPDATRRRCGRPEGSLFTWPAGTSTGAEGC